jgi:hypothetical protein
MATGRTSQRYVKFQIQDSGGTLRDVPVQTFSAVGLTYDEIDVSSLQEIVKSYMACQANFSLVLTGPLDNSAAVAASTSGQAAALSGSHTVLEPLNGLLTPLAFGIYFGIQGYWATNDPVFGADNSAIVTDYTVAPGASTYSCKLAHVGGGTAPSWGTTQITIA